MNPYLEPCNIQAVFAVERTKYLVFNRDVRTPTEFSKEISFRESDRTKEVVIITVMIECPEGRGCRPIFDWLDDLCRIDGVKEFAASQATLISITPAQQSRFCRLAKY